ncbi:MAG TPA: peroxiredoxin [Allosphingosinicella sp.]|nr:peroxiredoxin [Allosphingosinicella sp.]
MRLLAPALALSLAVLPSAAYPSLPEGQVAPDFSTSGALAGRPFQFNLRRALRNGPVVLYFYPRSFTEGCTLEAHAFSEAAPEFRRHGAQVIGLSADSYDLLRRFSVEACRNAFPVGMASRSIIRDYDVQFSAQRGNLTNRTSYVIAPNGRIIHVYSNLDWRNHVTETLRAVRQWRAQQRRRRR